MLKEQRLNESRDGSSDLPKLFCVSSRVFSSLSDSKTCMCIFWSLSREESILLSLQSLPIEVTEFVMEAEGAKEAIGSALDWLLQKKWR